MELFIKFVICFIAGIGACLGTGFEGMSAADVISPVLISFLDMGGFIMSRLSHKQKLYIIVGIAAVAVVLQYLLHLKLYAQILVTLVGAIIALSMFKEMIHTLRSGKYGVDQPS